MDRSPQTCLLNAAQAISENRGQKTDYTALRGALATLPAERVRAYEGMLLTLAACSSEEGMVARLRQEGLISQTTPENGRITHAALRGVSAANAQDLGTILAEDVRAMLRQPARYAPLANSLWAWQLLDAPVRAALIALGLRPVAQRNGNDFPFRSGLMRLWGGPAPSAGARAGNLLVVREG